MYIPDCYMVTILLLTLFSFLNGDLIRHFTFNDYFLHSTLTFSVFIILGYIKMPFSSSMNNETRKLPYKNIGLNDWHG